MCVCVCVCVCVCMCECGCVGVWLGVCVRVCLSVGLWLSVFYPVPESLSFVYVSVYMSWCCKMKYFVSDFPLSLFQIFQFCSFVAVLFVLVMYFSCSVSL